MVFVYILGYLVLGYLFVGILHRYYGSIENIKEFFLFSLFYPLILPIMLGILISEGFQKYNILEKLLKPFEKESKESIKAKISKLKEQEWITTTEF